MPRPAPVPGVAVLRSLLGLVGALVAGGVLVLLLFAASDAGVGWWAVVAGAFGCASGLMVGLERRTAPAAALGLVAAGAVVLAVAGSSEADRRAAFPARERLAIVPGPAADEPAPGNVPAVRDEVGRGRRAAKSPAVVDSFVRSYYAALDAGEFELAWARLAPDVRTAFGGLQTWRDGYASTLGHRVEDVTVERGGVVKHVLVAVDETPCGGETERRFAVTWLLAGGGDDLVATHLTAVKLAGVDPSAAC
jgi:hypothetical protein